MRSLALLLALLIALGGVSLDLCACRAVDPVQAQASVAMDEGCCCCAPVPPCCDAPVVPPQGPALEAGCGCGTLELPETSGAPSLEAPTTVVLTLAPAAPSLAVELRPADARALGPPDDPGRRRHLLLHVLRC